MKHMRYHILICQSPALNVQPSTYQDLRNLGCHFSCLKLFQLLQA